MRFIRLYILVILVACVLPASITRTARGTKTGTDKAKTLVVSVTASTGSSIVVGSLNSDDNTVSSIAWTGGTFSQVSGCTASDGVSRVEIWRAHNVTGGTNNLTLTLSNTSTSRTMFVTELAGSNGVPLTDVACVTPSTGNGTATSTGSTTCNPNSSADCAWIALTSAHAASISITYIVPTTAGQDCSITSVSSCKEGYEIDSSNKTQSGSATLGSTQDWQMAMAAFKEPAGAGGAALRDIIGRGIIPIARFKPDLDLLFWPWQEELKQNPLSL